MSTCRHCGLAVAYAETEKGRRVALDLPVREVEQQLSLFDEPPPIAWVVSTRHISTCPARQVNQQRMQRRLAPRYGRR